ncbi:UDP-2-acetamido-2,6-beta-L-arabino-hexul-4-ose reductase [Actinopolymorpha cephalotaxi]|uniref:UDP-2-acetamido-2,6-beta-L-arabino-hexul-4-ose reductase n=1 Tax=Actinopolymorpha cephalotaxi TaxID=504797 RepID=A0A1I2TEW8_9ACTN|nr:NAD-dependent epimerase/dehydratase family protein [Actinopolymorpha cephalotaxi]NYH82962.1 UDP-2-acetamido-2,6-beta-L-arabino-hexul-4-ose reductase [Actinopolymorpha cephalotaxi]SFG60861.1 UDP-2-acetamido-2,6-beta-L-arabino-hexul-4-ose reductase [Actinopolymorpha cephalotaxi]
MKVVVTGGHGFLGWHLRVRLRALTDHQVVAIGRADLDRLDTELKDADALIHLAGVNRGTDEEVEQGNVALAQMVGRAVRDSGQLSCVVFANSLHAGADTPYGRGKAQAGILLADSATTRGARFVDVVLPNLFGEHGRPNYNSFVATFVRAVVDERLPTIDDRPVELLHVQRASADLIGALEPGPSEMVRPRGEDTSVTQVWELLRGMHHLYRGGELPALTTQLEVDLFNTLRAAMFPQTYPMRPTSHRDERGDLVECVRSHGGTGQSFVSTSMPGVTRGDHFHLGKVERFLVVRGQAMINLRRLFHDEVISFAVSADSPAIVDMPTMWAHNIVNTGVDELVTFFWTHTMHDPLEPDTYAERVRPRVGSVR